MYDKEQQRLTKRKSVRPNAEAVEYHDFQRDSVLVIQLEQQEAGIVDGSTRRTVPQKFSFQYHLDWISDLAFQ